MTKETLALKMTDEAYEKLIGEIFVRFPSFQKAGASAYKPGLGNMEAFDSLDGHPHRQWPSVHIAGTNGKGSVSNMIASVLAASGMKVGLYTSPHILDFRERARIVEPSSESSSTSSTSSTRVRLIPREATWNFLTSHQDDFDRIGMSFFEITTALAFRWFADEEVDIAVIESGLGGRLDSTNIITPVLSIVTNIGLDHCDILGDTREKIAFEKAGIFKKGVPALVGESDARIGDVFLSAAPWVKFADRSVPSLWKEHDDILAAMDLQGSYQRRNLRTVLSALDMLRDVGLLPSLDEKQIIDALVHTARRTLFRGRWEKLCDNPLTICDIGHNSHGLAYNFSQLESMLADARATSLVMVYGAVADKDVDEIMKLVPSRAEMIFTTPASHRALAAEEVMAKYLSARGCNAVFDEGKDASRGHASPMCIDNVGDAVRVALERARQLQNDNPLERPLVYIGGSTYVVSEALAEFI